jgi:hypothetical protein
MEEVGTVSPFSLWRWLPLAALATAFILFFAVYASLGSGLGDIIASGRTPDLLVLFPPRVLLPLVALAALALVRPFLQRRAKRG